jgi:hypothetical protein
VSANSNSVNIRNCNGSVANVIATVHTAAVVCMQQLVLLSHTVHYYSPINKSIALTLAILCTLYCYVHCCYYYNLQIQRTPLGAFQTQVACPGCRGTGQKVEAYCSSCDGQGLIETTKPVKVRIPAGVVSSKLQLNEHLLVLLVL